MDKSEITKTQRSHNFDLEERTYQFAKNIRLFIKSAPKTLTNIEDFKQLTRSSGSTGANYIEANEALGKRDFYHKIRICRKEAKESRYWLALIDLEDKRELVSKRNMLLQEALELTKIFGSILEKVIIKKF